MSALHDVSAGSVGPFSIRPWLPESWPRATSPLVGPVVDAALGLAQLNTIYASIDTRRRASTPFWTLALEQLDVEVDVAPQELAAVPASGPLVVVANHPFGGVDGLALLATLHRKRGDVRVLGNRWLARIPELRPYVIPVDVFGGSRLASARNGPALRQALAWLKHGGSLAVFPAGEVSHRRWSNWAVTDSPWHTTSARLAQSAHATILPLCFHGANSRLFQFAGLVHPRLRTALLPRETLRRRACAVRLSIGSPIPASAVTRFPSAQALSDYARARVYVLDGRGRACRTRLHIGRAATPLAAGPSGADLRREIAVRPPERRLMESSGFSVWLTNRSETPCLVEEIGRLREATFRSVGEGTGQSSDLDRFDDHYEHLVVWSETAGEVVGAYRIARTDVVAQRFGARGLYTDSLFQLSGQFLAAIEPALELGRSFVRAEYQREFAPLMLLWKGIGQVVASDPRYAQLIGAVSISRDYSSMSRELLMAMLRTKTDEVLAPAVAPRNPPGDDPRRTLASSLVETVSADIDRVDELVREAERGERGMPVLLRQYLKLDARAVAFNVDPAFGDALDALMVVDLRRVAPTVLQKYMGRDGASRVWRAHEGIGGGSGAGPAGFPADPEPALA
jgi:putative hemolysin